MTTLVTEEYRMTELGPLPPEWQVVRLGDVAKIIMGQSPPGSTYNKIGNGTPFLQGKAEFGSTVPRHIKCTTKPQKIAPRGSVLISVRAPVGDVNIADIDYCIGRGLASLSMHAGDNIFLFYMLSYRKEDLEAEGTGSTFKAINKSKLQAFQLAFPSPPEQKKIAHALSTVQTAIEKMEAVIKTTREFKRSLMKHLFTYGPVSLEEAENVPLKETEIGLVPEGWEVVKLGAVCQKTRQADPTRNPEVKFSYIDVSSISRNFLSIVGSTEHLGANAPSRARKVIRQNDVIFATVRPYLKRITVVPAEFDGQICSTAFCVIRANPALADPLYLFHTVSRDRFVQRVSDHQRGSSYPAVTDKDVLNELIPLPSLSIQKQIVDVLSNVDKKLETEENKKKGLEALFQTFLSRLMTGQIRFNNLEVPV